MTKSTTATRATAKTEQKYKVVITDGISDVAPELEILGEGGCELIVANCRTAAEVMAIAGDADGLLVGDAPIPGEAVKALDKCRVIVRLGAGYDKVDIEAADAKGIAVCNVPGATTNEVADHSLALALSLARRLPMVDRLVRQGVWKVTSDERVKPIPAFGDMDFIVLGFGSIGKAVIERARAFGFRLAAYDPHCSDSELAKAGIKRVSLDEALQEADILSVHVPLLPETEHLLDAKRILQMKPGVILINTGRGELINTDALVEALRHHHIAYAGLDVFEEEPLPQDHPLYSLDNVILTPHMGAHSQHSGSRVAGLAAEELLRGLAGKRLKNQVNGKSAK